MDKDAANRYLEYVVVGKRSGTAELHESLLSHLLGQAEEVVRDDGIKYHLEELGEDPNEGRLTTDAEYRLLSEPQSYAEFFTEVAPPTPFKTLRLKLMLFLQNSSYDLSSASARLEAISVLVTERAIVLGRLGRHTDALKLVAQDLPDSVSAQTYCTQGGEIVPPKVARAMARCEPELAAWAALGDRRRRGTVDADTQHRLVVELLRAYMRDDASRARTATLLSAQGVHLDVDEVLDMAPADWPLDVVTTFYRRSYRRLLHERTTWQVLKSISAGENLEVSGGAATRASEPLDVYPAEPRVWS